MLNNNGVDNKTRPMKRGLKVAKSPLPRLSLNLHTMPQSSDQHLKRWLLWGLLILLVIAIIAYFLFN